MNKIFLSFCIPTYNRVKTLLETIQSIQSQQVDLPKEIVISDNSSDESTARAISALNTDNHLRYYHNSANIGPAANLIKVIELAQGEYIWLISDDDCIAPGGISHVIDLLKSNPSLDYVFASRMLCDRNMRPLTQGKQPIKLSQDCIFQNGKQLFMSCNGELPGLMGFISSTIIRKRVWKSAFEKVGTPLGNWSHLRVILYAIQNNPSAIMSGWYVLTRLNPSSEAIISNIWIDQAVDLLKTAITWGYDKTLCENNIKRCFYDFSKMFVLDKAMGLRDGNIYFHAKKMGCQKMFDINLPWFFLSFFPRISLHPLIWIINLRHKYLKRKKPEL
jgi:glycosyltransferase involved in cell wall biosynthesis